MAPVEQFKLFKPFNSVVHGVATARFGNLAYKYADANEQSAGEIREGRRQFFQALGVEENNVVGTQVAGGDDLLAVIESDRGKGVADPTTGLTGDGFFTSSREVFLFLVTGDCLVLFLYAPVNQVCGLVHTGWRGVDRELPRRAIEHMVNNHKCDPKEIRVGLSPALQKESAIFDNFEKFNQDSLEHWEPYTEQVDDKYQVDWLSFAKNQLLGAGVRAENIDNPGINTRTSPEFFSHRRSKEEKLPEQRFGCLIGLKA